MRPKYRKNWNQLNDWQKEELLGNVKQVMLVTYGAHIHAGDVVPGKIKIGGADPDANYILHFNDKGVKIMEQKFNEYGWSKEVYDDEPKSLYREGYNTEGKLRDRTEHIYEGKNLIAYRNTDENGKLEWHHTYSYNEQGKVTEHCSYRGDYQKLHAKKIHNYNELGNILSVIEYDANDTVLHKTEWTYNEKGLKTKYSSIYTSPEKALYNQWQDYSYNEQGDCIEMNYYNVDSSLKESHQFSYEYDKEGKRIDKNNNNDDEDEGIKTETEEVVNDAQGNWIKKTTWHNKIPLNIYIREFVYFGDGDKNDLVHPLSQAETRKAYSKSISIELEQMEAADVKWLVEEGGRAPENFHYLRYYALRFNDIPSVVSYGGANIEAIILRNELKKYLDAQEVHSYATVTGGRWEKIYKYTLTFPDAEGYLLQSTSISEHSKEMFLIPEAFDDPLESFVYIGQFQLLRPAEATGKRDEYFEERLEHYFEKCTLRAKPNKPSINVIEVKMGKFELVEYPVHDNFVIKDLNVNYGYGFERFHNELMNRFASGTKGLVLFHGTPGTGKTYYIRHLLRKMAASNKAVIYMPPNMVDHLAEPAFMTFLTGEIRDLSAEGKFCVLLIEDAEPLLAKRQEGVRIQGVTNLLNMSDGILNDMLNLQIICTFNVDLRKVDSALLRPGRLIARKEFKPLSIIDANLLAQRLGIKYVFDKPVTLSEIYAKQKNNNTLTHEVDADRGTSTLVDDLI